MTAEVLRRALRDAEVDISDADDGKVMARVRQGLRARTAALDLTECLERLTDGDDQRSAAAAFARGVHAVLAEPMGDAGASLTFEDAARTVLPSIEAPDFRAGVDAAGGDPPFTTGFPSGLIVVYRVELDHGIRLLTIDQVEGWGCTGDRLDKAALSILFHRSWEVRFEPTAETPGVSEFKVGDGLDGARVLMMNQWGYDHVRDAALFSLPQVDRFLLSTDVTDAGRDALDELTKARFASSNRPLSLEIFRFERGRIVGR